MQVVLRSLIVGVALGLIPSVALADKPPIGFSTTWVNPPAGVALDPFRCPAGPLCPGGRSMLVDTQPVVSADGRTLYVGHYGSLYLVPLSERGLMDGPVTQVTGERSPVVAAAGRRVYTGSGHVVERDPASGEITISDAGVRWRPDMSVVSLVVGTAPDVLYVVSTSSITTYPRGADGRLGAAVGCVGTASVPIEAGCVRDGVGGTFFDLLLVGRHGYATRDGEWIAAFDRDVTTGALGVKAGGGCYAWFDPCTRVTFPDTGKLVALGDGSRLAFTGPSGVAIFNRDATTGALTQPAGLGGCIGAAGAACGNIFSYGYLPAAPEAGGSSLVIGTDPQGDVGVRTRTFQRYRIGALGIEADGVAASCAGCWPVGDVTSTPSPIADVGYTSSGLTVDVRVRGDAAFCVPAVSTGRHRSVRLSDTCWDGAGGSLTLQPIGSPAHGTTVDGAYTPDPTFLGDVPLTVAVSDGVTTRATVVLASTTNAAPTCLLELLPVVLIGTTSVRFPAPCSDPDGDPLFLAALATGGVKAGPISSGTVPLSIVSGSTGGSVTLSVSDGLLAAPPTSWPVITEKPPTLALVYLLDQEGYPLLRAGTDGGVRAWKAWAGEPVTASWGFDGAPHYLDKTHLSSRPLVGGRRIIEGTPDPPDESAITIDESRRVRIVGDDTSGPVTAEAVVVHESAVQSAPFVIYAALPMRLTGTESGKISHVTAVIEGTAPDARGRLYLLRPIRKNVWRRVRYLPIDSAGQAYFSLPLDNKLYALDYIPKNRRDLIPTHYTFHMKLIFGLRRGRVHAVLDRIERRFGASVVG